MSAQTGASTAAPVAWLDLARVVATVAVVVLHTSSSVVSSAATGSPAWWTGNLYDSATRWCVPVFVMISGALLLDERRSEGIGTFYWRRSSRIVAPLVFWAAAFTVWKAYLAQAEGAAFSWRDGLLDIALGRPFYHLWFLYMLLCLYLVTPLIRLLVRRLTRPALLALVVALFAVSAAAQLAGLTERAERIWPLWFLPFVSYFVAGHLIVTSSRRGGRLVAWVVFVLAAAATAAWYFRAAGTEGVSENIVVHDYLGLTVIPMAFAVFWLLRGAEVNAARARALAALAALTLGVYALHPLFVEIIRRHWPLADRLPLVSIPVVAALIVATSLGVTAMIRRVPVLRGVV
ncbi:MAG TPA: acyltransferase family protein [Aeromicrobium sp.]|nr:acyltransferase family protein [Aeromicrobium sp.]